MCIAVVSTAHPKYPFILISNRDEILRRPTATAHWWEEPNEHVLGGRDLQRAERGTWLGITRQGRIALLTNFRDEGVEVARDKSRGAIVSAYLVTPPESDESAEAFAQRLMNDVGIHDVGGFSLLYGRLRGRKGDGGNEDGVPSSLSSLGELSILSNRTTSADGLVKICGQAGETHGLSNSFFGDLSWPKVVHGEQLLRQAIGADVARGAGSQRRLLDSLFDVLSVDTLPKRSPDQPWHEYTRTLRHSILIRPVGGEEPAKMPANEEPTAGNDGGADKTPAIKGNEALYGTHKQTVILVDAGGKVVYEERTLYDQKARRVDDDERERRFEFTIQ